MPSAKTCVILVSYRGASDTAACLRSLLASTVPAKLLVVDTTPNDPELEAALRFATGVTILRAPENVGFGRGNNLGIQWALQNTGCEFFFLLNNDTLVQQDSIEVLEAAMASQKEVGIMVPRIAYIDAPDMLWYGGGDVDWRRASAFTPGINQSASAPLALEERDVSFATGCALFLRRSVLEKLGGFDPRFFMYEEDVELCLRARESGVRLRYIPSSFILHRAQGSNQDSSHARMDFWSTENPNLPFLCYHVIRNRMLNIAAHARGRDFILALCFFPLFLIRRAGPFLAHGRLDAVAAMLKGLAVSWTAMRAPSREAAPAAHSATTSIP